MSQLDVVVPTRNRPAKLRRCLEALAAAREHVHFTILVCDSSDARDTAQGVRDTCDGYPFVTLCRHSKEGVSAARNRGAELARAPLHVTVDDDVYVEPHAIRSLVETYRQGRGWRVVAGSVAWEKAWSRPVVMRPIGYGRWATEGEAPSFLVSALLLYPRALALSLPWPEQILTSEDRFMGALWRSLGVSMLFDPNARAEHDHEHTFYGVEHQQYHLYTNLFDALIANPDLLRALSYEFLGFAAGLKAYKRSLRGIEKYVIATYRAHRILIRDWRELRNLARVPLPQCQRSDT